MNKTEFNQSISFKVYPQKHVRADGLNTIYLRVTIDRRKREFNLHVYWPAAFYDLQRQVALPRFAKDKEVNAVNMIIDEAKGRSNRIRLRYFTEGRMLTLDQFAKEFDSYDSRDNFLVYMEEKIKSVTAIGALNNDTAIRHNTQLGRLRRFNGGNSFLSMGDITADFVMKYQDWLTKKGGEEKDGKPKPLSYNTVVNAIKTFQTYVNHAQKEGFKIADAFGKVKKKYQAGNREALDQSELKRLQRLLKDETLPEECREVLRKFLFSCFTGIRISDNATVTKGNIKNGVMHIKLKKGRTHGKEVYIPLPNFAKDLISGRKGAIFPPIADQKCNDWLKVIAAKADIDKHLTFHVSRDTFATLFLELGGDVYTLKELLGHSSIQTTMIYVKMSEKRKEALMSNFNTL
jgi:integrase/recombinase XerD